MRRRNEDDETIAQRSDWALSHHILPSAATMVGVCTTLIGLVKIVEGRIGPSRVDEWAALTALIFLGSAVTSYLSIRIETNRPSCGRFEAAADLLFLLGLIGLSVISLLFAYEVI
jgi:hypothetical protein